MPVVYKAIDITEVMAILRTRGYGQVVSRQFAGGIALNRETGRRFASGGFERKTVGGIDAEKLTVILNRSENAEQAANLIESTILGKEMLPVDTAQAQAAPSGVSLDVVEKLISNRTATEVAKALSPVQDQMHKMMERMQALADIVSDTISEVRKPKKKPSMKEKAAAALAIEPTA